MPLSMLDQLLANLDSTTPDSRIEALCVIVMLQETQALDKLAHIWKTDPNAEVRQAIVWAGKQLQPLKDAGYSTEFGMNQMFRLHLGVEDPAEAEERRKMEQLQRNLSAQSFTSGANEKSGQTGMLVLRGAVAGGMLAAGFGPGAAAAAFSSGVDASSNLGPRPEIGKEPIVPPRPGTMDIQLWTKRLTTGDSKAKNTAILQLREFNNPAALTSLAQSFIKDPDPAVRQAAQDTGKFIYFSTLYWEKRTTVS
jgi:hypothetical protein